MIGGFVMYSCGPGDISDPPTSPPYPPAMPAATPSPSGSPIVPLVCTDQFVYGVSIAIRAPDGAPIHDATMTLLDGAYQEQMRLQADGLYVGAGERPGRYQVLVSAPGFEPQTLDQVVVNGSTCHVIQIHRDLVLSPEMP